MKFPFPDWLANVLTALLFLMACLPLLALSFHNHPSAADDYCFADTTLRYGFWQAQKFYYDGWTGRYFSNMLVHGSPLVWGWYDGYRFLPALLVVLLLASIHVLLSELLRGEALVIRLRATALLFFLIVLALQSTVEAFFWTAAVATYMVPTILTIYLMAVIIRWYALPAGLTKKLTAVWAGFLVFASIGSGETNLILLLLVLLAITGYRLLFLRRFDPFLSWLVVVALLSAWLLLRAPGNAIRMGSNEHSGELIKSLGASAGWLAHWVGRWLLKTPLLPLSVLFLPVAQRLVRPNSPVGYLFQLPVGLLTVVYLATLVATIFPSYYGLGMPPFARSMNVLFIFFALGWFYVLTAWVAWLERIAYRLPAIAGSMPVLLLASGWVVLSISISPSLKQLYQDWFSGRAATYDREMTARHQQLLVPADTLRLAPISVGPLSLFLEDIKPDQKHWWNRCQSGYYNHNVIILDSTLTATTQRD